MHHRRESPAIPFLHHFSHLLELLNEPIHFLAIGAGDVLAAATVGGAKALGRDDLGRLAPGLVCGKLIFDLVAVPDDIYSLGSQVMP